MDGEVAEASNCELLRTLDINFEEVDLGDAQLPTERSKRAGRDALAGATKNRITKVAPACFNKQLTIPISEGAVDWGDVRQARKLHGLL